MVNSSCPSLLPVVISRRQKRVQLMRIREKDTKKRQQAGGQEGTYRRKATPVKRYAGDLLAPVSGTQLDMCRSDFYQFSVVRKKKTIYICCRGFSAGHHHCTSFTSPCLSSSSQSYLQSLRDKQMDTGTSLSSLGTTNQTVIDLDFDTGSTAPLTTTTPVVRV